MNDLETVDSKVLEVTVATLEAILEDHNSSEFGLCMSLELTCPSELLTDSTVARVELFTRWPECSSNVEFPVPCPDGGCPENAFYKSRCLYTGPYGESRLRLAQFMIDECNKELNRRSTQC